LTIWDRLQTPLTKGKLIGSVHASASGNGFDFAQPLFTAVQVIEADSGHGHSHN
jgi:hypothetical protein